MSRNSKTPAATADTDDNANRDASNDADHNTHNGPNAEGIVAVIVIVTNAEGNVAVIVIVTNL
ncbi:hypothetical protein DPMN_138304 [Dreissena polymorpha]|uniref:Uncharacterized protein n=1 Tax=Dreissena polymorpha TaxID=45954 RepID=A0A9D4G483_DREPO|nr:hypothetical protein DPMN_138304 [Dreissena polymorpha]